MKQSLTLTLLFLMIFCRAWAEEPDLEKQFYASKKMTVEEIIGDMERVDDSTYQQKVFGSDKPVIVFFYNNKGDYSKGLAALVVYLVNEYEKDIKYLAFKLSEEKRTPKDVLRKAVNKYGINEVPSLFLYDNDKGYIKKEDWMEGGIISYEFFLKNIDIFTKHIPKNILD